MSDSCEAYLYIILIIHKVTEINTLKFINRKEI